MLLTLAVRSTLRGGCGRLPSRGGKHCPCFITGWRQALQRKTLRASLLAVTLLVTFHVGTVTHASTQSGGTSFAAARTALQSVEKKAGQRDPSLTENAPSRSLAASNVIRDASASWQEAEELSRDEASTLAALWDTLESLPGVPTDSVDADPSLAEGRQNSPSSTTLTRSTESAGGQKPRYRVIQDGEGGAMYELAEELDHDLAGSLLDRIVTENGLKPDTTTTTTTTPPPILRFRQCADASARGYSMPFACCSVQNGDFYDKQTWHCGRIPTSLDAVFIRHFVRLPASRSKLEIRALWLVKSIDAPFEGKTGILRSGQLLGARCWAETVTAGGNAMVAPSVEELNTLREVFGGLLGSVMPVSKASLSDLCASLRAEPFLNEEDFRIERPTAVVIKDPGTEPLGPTAAEIAYTGTTEAFNAYGSLHGKVASTTVDRQVHVETNLPVSGLGSRGGPTREGQKSPTERRTVGREQHSNKPEIDKEGRQEEDKDVTSPIVPFDFGRVFQPVAGLANRLPPSSTYPYLSVRARGLGIEGSSRRRNFAEPLSLKGMPTVRVEPGAALLLLSGTSVVTDAPIRNDGILFIGEVLIPEEECLERRPPSQQGMCRIPSLSIGGSLIAKTPVHIHWLQLSSPLEGNNEAVVWYGRLGYPPALPGSSSSTVTFFGSVKVDKVLPGSSFSFRRLGFPPYPPPPQSPQKTTLQVKQPKESVDLVIYADVIDDDGFIDCCEDFYDREPAVFELTGVNLKLGPFSRRRKDIGEQGKISEQIILRANKVTTDETFVGLPALISAQDAKVTNSEEQQKQAGTNRDILFFQCFEECRISNQIFKAKKGYKYVQVTRDLPAGRFQTMT